VDSAEDRLDVMETCTRMARHVDLRDWGALLDVFPEKVRLDYTSLIGGQRSIVTAQQVADAWSSCTGTRGIARRSALRCSRPPIGSPSGREVDVLININNAGVYSVDSFFALIAETFAASADVHPVGAFRTCQALLPAMARRGYGRIGNVPSGLGAVTAGNTTSPSPAAYGVAPAVLNALARKSIEQGADTVDGLALPADGGPSGGFFRDRRRVP